MNGAKHIFKALSLYFFVVYPMYATDLNSLLNDCDKNHIMTSCQELGNYYWREKRDKENAVKYYRKVCDANFSDDCMSLAMVYERSLCKDGDKLLKFYTKACQLNNPYACNNLGNLYKGILPCSHKHKSIDKNITKAILLFEKSYCLAPQDKPFDNRKSLIEEYNLTSLDANTIDCYLLHYNETMNSSGQVDREVGYH